MIASARLEAKAPNWDTAHVKILYTESVSWSLADPILCKMGGTCNHGQWINFYYAILFKAGLQKIRSQLLNPSPWFGQIAEPHRDQRT